MQVIPRRPRAISWRFEPSETTSPAFGARRAVVHRQRRASHARACAEDDGGMKLERLIRQLGGLAATHELYTAGATRWQLARAIRDGRLLRPRQGWYCLPETPEPIVRAVRVGGRLGCVSAARQHGLAVRASAATHVAVAGHTSRLRTEHNPRQRLARVRSKTVVHWGSVDTEPRTIESPLLCLLSMARCQSPERVVAAADSALRAKKISRSEWRRAILVLPTRLRALLDEADGIAQSITESVVLFRLRRLGVEPRQQVAFAGVGHVDFLIGELLVIEVDGRAFHSDEKRFETDRRRDARLSVHGRRVLRFSYKQVFERWSEVRAAIFAALERGDHLG